MMYELTWKDLKTKVGEPVMIRLLDECSKWVLIEERADDWFGKAYACVDAHGMRYMLRKSIMKQGMVKVYDRFTELHAEVQSEEDDD